ncbi:MAG: DNRLRE domain-containing protein, partial [Deltaproteobacteria bacterium]
MRFRHTVARRALGFWIVLGLLPFLSHRGKAQALPSTTLTFSSTADTYVDSGSATKNFNSSTILRAAASPTRVTYLRFAVTGVSGRQVQKARLRLGVSAGAASGGTVHLISNNTWSETAVTFNTRPAVDGAGLQTLGTVATGATAEFILDGAITADGTYNLAIDSSNTATVSYNSSLATSGQKPQLVLTVAAQAPTVTIAQPPTGASYFTGDAITLQASAHDSAGVDLSTHVVWSSNLAGPLGTGAVVTTSLGQGTHTLTATVTDGQGLTGSSQISVTVTPPPPGNTAPLVSITAPASGQTLASSATITFTGSASDLEDGDLTAAIAWTSDRDGALGTGGSITHLLSEGTHQLTATVADRGGLTATATVTVQVVVGVTLEFPAVADAAVDAGLPTTNFGTSPTLAADANLVRNTYLRFTTSGLATRTILGAVLRLQVDATSGAESDSGGTLHTITDGTWQESTITFNNRPAVDGPTVASQGPVRLGQTVDFNVASAVTGDGTYNFALVNTSSDECDYRSREGGPAPKLVLTVAGSPPSVTISSPADGAVRFHNDTITLAGRANDVTDGDLSSQIQWTSSRDGALGTGATISTSTLSVGTHVITAAATDTDGQRGQAQVSIRVRNPNVAPVVTISAPADGASAPAGTMVTLGATATDDFDGNVTSKIQWASSRDGALGGGGTRTVTLSEGTHVLTASVTDSDGATGSAQVRLTVTPTPPVVAITGPADGTTVFAGTSLAFSGTANDATDGNLSASLRWTSDRDGLIGSGASFTTTRLSAGTHVITASATDRGGLSGQALRTVVVRPPNTSPAVQVVAPANGTSLITGKPVLLAATAADAEDGDLAAAIRWSSSRDGALGTGGAVVVPSLSVGTHTLSVSATDRDGATTTATVTLNVVPTTVTFAAVADTYVDSSTPSGNFGTATSLWADNSPTKQAFLRFAVSGLGTLTVQQAKLRMTVGSASASLSNSGGIVRSITNNTWSEATTTYNTRPAVDGPTLASQASVALKQVVDFDVTTGVHGDGTYNLAIVTTSADEVIYNSREASSGQPQLVLTLGENQTPYVRITAPPSGSKVLPGAAVTFTGAATDAENGNLSSQIQWTSSLDGPLGTGASVTLSSLRSGIHTITARVADAGGLTAQAQITVNVLNTPVVRITAPANGAAFFAADGPITLTGSATDVEDGNLSGRLQWSSDRDGALAIGATILASQLSIGTHTITAMAIDDDGLHGQASISIRVRGPNQPPAIAITSPADGTSVPAGTPTALTATVTDDFDTNLAGQVRWTSDRDGALGNGPRTVTLSEGSHILTAAVTDSNNATASAQVHVTIVPSPPVVTITAPAAGTRVFAGTTLTFSGTAMDATDGNLTAGLRWTSDRDGAIGSGAAFSTSRLSIGTHTITATATDRGNLVGQAPLTLIIRGPNVPPVVTIVKPADGGALLGGKPVLLSADATDAEDGDLSAAIHWTSSLDGALGTGGLVLVPSLSIGTHTLTAVVTDGDGATATTSVTVAIRPSTLILSAVADTYVDASQPTVKLGTQTSLWADASPVKQAYLRFQVTGIGSLAVQSAHLKLTASSVTAAPSPSGGALHTITDNTWSEATTTFNNRPAVDGPTLGTQGAVALRQVVDFDVSTAVRSDGTYNFGLVTTNADEVIYNSREASSGQPQLFLTLAQNQTPAVTITAPASGTKRHPGDAITFTGRALDAENGDLSSQIQWRSDIDGLLGTGASLTYPMLSPGTHTISARVTDASGLAAEAHITVVVAHPPMVGIAAPPDGSVYYLTDLPVSFTGQASDVEDGDLT